MTIRLSEDLEKQIQERVHAGRAGSVQEFVEDALRHMLADEASPSRTRRRRSATELFDEIWSDAPVEALQQLPPDGADQVDHYIYGVQKR